MHLSLFLKYSIIHFYVIFVYKHLEIAKKFCNKEFVSTHHFPDLFGMVQIIHVKFISISLN